MQPWWAIGTLSDWSGDVEQWEQRMTCNRSVVSSNPSKGSRCFSGQDILPSLLSTGWFQERIREGFTLVKSACFRIELIKTIIN